jgi:hypothetical protein
MMLPRQIQDLPDCVHLLHFLYLPFVLGSGECALVLETDPLLHTNFGNLALEDLHALTRETRCLS